MDKYPFMMTHFTDFLFVYDFEDNSKNKVFKKVKIEPKNETVFDFSKELEPKLIFLNYNDYGYFKIDISYANLINLKIFLTKCKDLLLKSSLISSLYNTFIDKKINSIEFLNIILPVIEIEENVTILSNILNNVISVIEIYLPLKYISIYKKKIFNILKNRLENQLNIVGSNEEILKLILIHINGYSIEEEHKKYLIKLLNLDYNLLDKNKRLSYIKSIYSSITIPLEDKKKLLNNEIQNDIDQNLLYNIKLYCDAILPDRKNKEKIWKILTEEYNSDNTNNFEALMMGFAPIDQYYLIEDFLTEKFFEIFSKIEKYNENFIINYINYLAPFQFTNDSIIKKISSIINNYKDNEIINLYLKEVLNNIKRKKEEEKKCEIYLNNLKNM